MRKLISKRLFAVLMAALLFAALGTTALADDAPVINTDVPAALTVIEGQTLTLTVEATGGELSYQWYRVHPEGDTPVEDRPRILTRSLPWTPRSTARRFTALCRT